MTHHLPLRKQLFEEVKKQAGPKYGILVVVVVEPIDGDESGGCGTDTHSSLVNGYKVVTKRKTFFAAVFHDFWKEMKTSVGSGVQHGGGVASRMANIVLLRYSVGGSAAEEVVMWKNVFVLLFSV